ncbi:hypothetical protein [Plantactinospora sp. GCM10030261]|uniref:hypothetical protein n=1 Tax=Plantactinospora sp. GCM10030261 TaxID=3273420 RepID=UPI00360F7C77
MSPLFAIFLVLLLGSSSYAAGRLHGQLSYRVGYRFGYRQGYFDGDRGAWNRRRREAQAALASVLINPPARQPTMRTGTTYRGAACASTAVSRSRPTAELGGSADERRELAGRQS